MEQFPNKSGFYDHRIAEIIHNAIARHIDRGTYKYGYDFDPGQYCSDSEISEIARISAEYRIEIVKLKNNKDSICR